MSYLGNIPSYHRTLNTRDMRAGHEAGKFRIFILVITVNTLEWAERRNVHGAPRVHKNGMKSLSYPAVVE